MASPVHLRRGIRVVPPHKVVTEDETLLESTLELTDCSDTVLYAWVFSFGFGGVSER